MKPAPPVMRIFCILNSQFGWPGDAQARSQLFDSQLPPAAHRKGTAALVAAPQAPQATRLAKGR